MGIASHYLPARSRYAISLKVSFGARTSIMGWTIILRQSVSDMMRSKDKDNGNVDWRYRTKISLTQWRNCLRVPSCREALGPTEKNH